jgi:agmatine deiminase
MNASAISVPAEWARHRAIWTAWPSDPLLWEDDLAAAREEVAAMVEALAQGDQIYVLASGEEALGEAPDRLSGSANIIAARFGDIWLRDTGPIFVRIADAPAALGFDFNGWGGKYMLEGDASVSRLIAGRAKVNFLRIPFVLEGGAVEHDGEGTILTTRQCLLNPNRNPGWTEAHAEQALAQALGARKVLWLDDGLANDHTDGHIDNLARFIGPGRVVCQEPTGADPNGALLDRIARDLGAMTDAAGRTLELVRIPSPGLVRNEDGEAIPASHMNFVIGNRTVVVPTYNAHGQAAVEALAPLFPGRRVVGLSAKAILSGGGGFHCITQQEPE